MSIHSPMRHVMPLPVPPSLRPTILYDASSLLTRHGTTARLSHSSASNDAPAVDAQPTVTSNDGGRTLRSRKHENKSLPLPFLMDAKLQKAKQRHREPKPRMIDMPTEAALDFRKRLNKNEHAQALATKCRMCQATRARLPDHFLVPFIAEMPALDNAEELGETNAAPQDASKTTQSANAGPTLVPAIDVHGAGTPSTYILCTKTAVDHVFGKKGKSQILVHEHMKKRYAAHIGQNIEKASADWLDKTRKAWPAQQHMSDTILTTLRRRVVDRLAWCAKEEDEHLPGGRLMSQTVLGRVEDPQEDAEEGEAESTPPRLLYVQNSSSYYDAAGEHVDRPKEEMEKTEYDLLKLLGPELCEELKEKHLGGWGNDSVPVLLRHYRSVKPMLALQKLKDYLEDADERKEPACDERLQWTAPMK